MRSLLIVAHGSRRQASNEEVRYLTKIISAVNSGFDDVDCAFLELANPTIPEGLENSIKRGAQEIVVMPYFLAAGRHVAEDIPDEIAPVQDRHRGVNINVVPHLGASTMMTTAILELASKTSTAL